MNKNSRLLFLLAIGLSWLVACSPANKSGSTATKSKRTSTSKLSDQQHMLFDRLFYDANKEKMLNNFPEAANLFRKCLQIDPSSAASMYELANLLYVKGDYVNAESYCRSALTLQPQNEWYQSLYADALTRNKKFADAIKVREKMCSQFPDRLDLKYDLATAYWYASRFDEAIDTYNEIEKISGINRELIERKKLIYIQQNKLDKAIIEVKKLIDSDPSQVMYYGMLAELYAANKMNEKAMEMYQMILKIEPENAMVHLMLSDYYGHQKQPEKAFEEMKLAFNNAGLEIEVKIKQLLPYYSNAEFNDTIKSQAFELLTILEKTHPKEAMAFSIYGDFLYRDKKFTEAKDKYKKAVEIDKDKQSIWIQLLFVESQINDYQAMLTDSKEAMELFPNEPTTFFFNGVANLQLGDNKAAIKSLEKGVDLVVENKTFEGQFYANLGDAYYRDKQMGKSDSAYEKALEINPKDTYVLNNYSYYLSLRNVDLDKAETMSRQANELEPENGNSQDTYAWILYAQKKYLDAKIWIEKAIVNGGDKNPVILEHYGDILFKLNEKNKALEYWMKAKDAGKGSDFLEKKINEKTLFE